MSQATFHLQMTEARATSEAPALLWILLAATVAASAVLIWASLNAARFGDLLTPFTT